MSQIGSVAVVAGDREAGTSCPHCTALIRLGEPVSVCRSCGTAHHELCWSSSAGCGSYECAPARRTAPATPALRISASELNEAPLHVSPLPTYAPGSRSVPPPPTIGRRSRMALWSFILALLGIPLFGLITGMVAIVLGSLALGSIRHNRQKGSGFAVTGVLLGLADVVGWLVLVVWTYSGGPPSQLLDFQPDLTSLDDLSPPIKRAMRANVLIESRHSKLGRLGRSSIGSGVILSLRGGDALILTNRHVVDSSFASKPNGEPKLGDVNVLLLGALPQTGQVVWVAPDGVDAAVVRVPCTSTKAMTAPWRLGHRPRVGEQVFAIGNPQSLGWTYTQGAVSQYRIQDTNGRRVSIIQTQTAINPGNSGGGLYDKEGNLVGINTWTTDRRSSEGLNFAISLETLAEMFPANLDLHPNKGVKP